ncbi:MAG: transposase [Alphaproteobacteria bacterium]|nr:transposase [Alphaproteobacteria bacterium]
MTINMDTSYDKIEHYDVMKKTTEKVMEEFVMMLLYLCSQKEGIREDGELILKAWKRYEFDIMNVLEHSGYIKNKWKNESVYLTDEGISYARTLLKKYNLVDLKLIKA